MRFEIDYSWGVSKTEQERESRRELWISLGDCGTLVEFEPGSPACPKDCVSLLS